MSTISAGNTLTTGYVQTSDTTGNLVFQTNGTTTALTINTSQNAIFANAISTTGNITGGNVRGMIPPNVQVFTSGSGTYTTPTSSKYLFIQMVGGGGGGCGSGGAGSAGVPGNGGTTTFGSALLTCPGGGAGSQPPGGNPGATPTGGDVNLTGSAGAGGPGYPNTFYIEGGLGGTSYFGGAGKGGYTGSNGSNGTSGSGGGGGGLYSNSTPTACFMGGGGASGGYLEKTISSPLATYSYAVGAGGTAGTAGTTGLAGGAGGAGLIIVTAYF
jgi:hypothetical protein